MKQKPLFADYLLANPGKVSLPPRTDLRALLARIRRAERLVFDNEATARVGQVLHEIPELLIEQIQFARAPFDLCWIEYKADVIWGAVTGQPVNTKDMTRDEVVGILIDHNRINVFSRAYDGSTGILPFVYHLNTEWPLSDQLDFCAKFKISRIGIDEWLWGSISNQFIAKGQRDRLRILRDTTMVEYVGAFPHTHILDCSMGDFKNVVALLLMLNQPSVTQYAHVPMRRGWIGNKPKPFLAHHNVNVSLDAKARLVVLGETGEGELRRRHRVRGHYCHDQTARDYARIVGCIHDWDTMHQDWTPWLNPPLDAVEHWKCRTCEGKRWWRDAHERGSEEKGFIEHQYNVTA